jgi:hypothetical protein
MSIAREGLQPPGTTKIRTPSPAVPCFSTTSLNFVTALSVKLTITYFLLAEICAILVSGVTVSSFYNTNTFNESQLFFYGKISSSHF